MHNRKLTVPVPEALSSFDMYLITCHLCNVGQPAPTDAHVAGSSSTNITQGYTQPVVQEGFLTLVSSKYGCSAFLIPGTMKMLRSGISPRRSLTMAAHLLHAILNPLALSGAFLAACSRQSRASVYSSWMAWMRPRK